MITDLMDKDVTIALRLSKDEHTAWLAAAATEDMSLSQWIRRRCNGQKVAPPIAPSTKKSGRR